jgi:hypothetical protein
MVAPRWYDPRFQIALVRALSRECQPWEFVFEVVSHKLLQSHHRSVERVRLARGVSHATASSFKSWSTASRLVIHSVSIELFTRSGIPQLADATVKRNGYQSNELCYASSAILPRMANHGYCGHLSTDGYGKCEGCFAVPNSNWDFEESASTASVTPHFRPIQRKRGMNFPAFALVWVLFVIARLFWNVA